MHIIKVYSCVSIMVMFINIVFEGSFLSTHISNWHFIMIYEKLSLVLIKCYAMNIHATVVIYSKYVQQNNKCTNSNHNDEHAENASVDKLKSRALKMYIYNFNRKL